MLRYCREKADPAQVYIWTEQIAKKDELEEVWAMDAEDARRAPAAPKIETVGPSDLATMTRRQLMAFGVFRAEVELTGKQESSATRAQLAEMICDKLGWEMPKMVEIGAGAVLSSRADGEGSAPADVTQGSDTGAGLGNTDARQL